MDDLYNEYGMIKLRKCPICGGEAIIRSKETFEQIESKEDLSSMDGKIYCDECGGIFTVVPQICAEDVAKWWNRQSGGVCCDRLNEANRKIEALQDKINMLSSYCEDNEYSF